MQSQTAKETESVIIRLTSITVSMILTYVCGKKCLVANWMIPDLPHKPSNNFKRDPSPILNLVSVVELTLRNRYKGSKSLCLEIRNGCSKTKLLLAEGWWCCKSPVSVFHGIKPKEKLTLNTVGWSANIRLSCSRRLAGLMVERRKLYQSCSLFWRLKRVGICDQCCPYVWAISSSELETRLVAMWTGSASQLEPAVAADAWEAAGRVPGSADFLALFAPSVSFEVVALRLRFFDGCCWCEVRTWALKQARLWKDSPHVLRENVRSAIHFLCALRWMIADLSENFLSPQLHSYGFSPVWVRTWVFRWLGLEKICTQVSHRCSLRGFLAVGSPSPDWMAYN